MQESRLNCETAKYLVIVINYLVAGVGFEPTTFRL